LLPDRATVPAPFTVSVFAALVLLMLPETASVSPLATVAVTLSFRETAVEIVALAVPLAIVIFAPFALLSKVSVLLLPLEITYGIVALLNATVPTVSAVSKFTGLAPVPKIAVSCAACGGGVPEVALQLAASDQMPVALPSVHDAEGRAVTVKMSELPLIETTPKNPGATALPPGMEATVEPPVKPPVVFNKV
jgi:hypothetical protein